MTASLRWGGDPEDVYATFSGPATAESLAACLREIRTSPNHRDDLRVILDHRQSDWTGITAKDIERRAAVVMADAEPGDRHLVATIVSVQVAYGLNRMLQAYVDGSSGTVEQLFYDVEPARAWLRESLR